MSTAKHTAGPWFHDVEDQSIRAPYPNHTSGISIARITCFGAHDVHMALEANAKLIAAAPELLEACKALLATALKVEDKEWANAVTRAESNRPCDLARAAITKAEGKA